MNEGKCMKGLYIVTPDWDDTKKLVEITEQALRGGAEIVQYRHKTADQGLRKEQARELMSLCYRYRKPFIINDHVELAMEVGADGIHVGGTDAAIAEVRKQVGPTKIIGASCYGDLELAKAAHAAGASYVAFGGFYPSRVKKYPVTTSVDIIGQSKAIVPLPVVVIGGMTPENSVPLIAAGTDMVAAISSVYMQADPEAAARKFADLFA
jgi:thiamine-phosphate pyrophosphorylase